LLTKCRQAWVQKPENRCKSTFQNDGVPRGFKVVQMPDGSEDLVRLTPKISEPQPSARPSKDVIEGRIKKGKRNRSRKKRNTGYPAT